MSMRSQALRNSITFVVIFGLLFAVNFLPPDTSLARIRESGVLRACVPDQYPPLVTGDAQRPGIDIEILMAVAQDLGLRLAINNNPAMGRDFNPRNWRVTRAQCAVLGGGVVASETTRSFLETTPPHLETGWAIIMPAELQGLEGSTVGFYAGIAGLNRIALSRFLRESGASVVTVNSSAALAAGLRDGRFDAAVSEALTARRLAADGGWEAQWLPAELGRYPVVLGLWKGDLTFKRALTASLGRLERRGVIEAILERYELAPLDDECRACAL